MKLSHSGKLVLVAVMCGLTTSATAQFGQEPVAPATTLPAKAGEPRLEISPLEFDFGEVWQGAPARCEFTVQNAGTAPLTLDVRSGCGCTLATRPKSPLAPGESATFSTTYNTDTYTGPASKRVTVVTNDPDRKEVVLPVKGNVKPLFQATPSNHINFQVVGAEEVQSQTMRLQNRYDSPLTLKIKDGQDLGKFDVTLTELVPGKEWDLTATTKPPLPVGFSRTTVTVETGLNVPANVAFFVSANAQPRVFATPPKLYVAANAAEPTQQMVRVQSRTDTPIKITGLEATPDSVQCELLPEGQSTGGGTIHFQEVRVSLPAFDDLPAEGAKLVIHTDDPSPEYRSIEVPILKYTSAMRQALPARGGQRPAPLQAQPREQKLPERQNEKAGGDS